MTRRGLFKLLLAAPLGLLVKPRAEQYIWQISKYDVDSKFIEVVSERDMRIPLNYNPTKKQIEFFTASASGGKSLRMNLDIQNKLFQKLSQ